MISAISTLIGVSADPADDTGKNAFELEGSGASATVAFGPFLRKEYPNAKTIVIAYQNLPGAAPISEAIRNSAEQSGFKVTMIPYSSTATDLIGLCREDLRGSGGAGGRDRLRDVASDDQHRRDLGGDFPIAPLLGIAAALIIGLITAVAALRVRGVSLAVVTLAGAVAIEQFGFGNAAWGEAASGSPVNPLHVFGLNLSPEASFRGIDGKVPSPVFGFVVLVVLILMCLLVAAIRRPAIGQRMLAVRSNERAAAAAGIDVRRVKLTAFMVSALIAAVCGALYAYNFETVSSDLFGSVNALVIIAYAYFGGITMISGALFAGLGATQGLIPQAFDTWWGLNGTWALLIGAIGLLVTLVANPDGIAGTAYWKRRAARMRASGMRGAAVTTEPREPAGMQ